LLLRLFSILVLKGVKKVTRAELVDAIKKDGSDVTFKEFGPGKTNNMTRETMKELEKIPNESVQRDELEATMKHAQSLFGPL